MKTVYLYRKIEFTPECDRLSIVYQKCDAVNSLQIMGSLEIDDDIKAFLVESYENLNQIEQVAIALEDGSTNQENLGQIYRAFHTIKGNCGFLPFPQLESVVHAGENLLGNLREHNLSISTEIIDTLLRAIDTIRQILAQIEATGKEGDSNYSALIAALQEVGSREWESGSREDGDKGDKEDKGDKGTRGQGSRRAEGQRSQPRAGVSPVERTGVGRGAEENSPTHHDAARSSIARDTRASACFPMRGEPALPPASPRTTHHSLTNYQLPITNSSDSTIRVDVELLDRVMNLVGELVLARNQVVQFASTLEDSSFIATCQQLHQITSQLQEGVLKTRMQPIGKTWQKFPRIVRDLAIACGKQVQVEMSGADTELDRSIVEAIKDPLIHIVRNCIAHGIESPEIRQSRGKPSQGKLSLHAWHESGTVRIEISDDGNGIDPQQLKQQARELGIVGAAEIEKMSEAEALNLIFLPGFSTAAQVTNLSGRGVGMDVVKANLAAVDGTVEVESQVGKGTKFKLKIPLTLAIIPALVVSGGTNYFAIPQVSIQELIRLELEPDLQQIEFFYNRPVYRLRGKLLPLVCLNQTLQLQSLESKSETLNIVVINEGEYYFGLIVDEIQDIQDIVIKPLGKQLRNSATFAGATILGTGKIALIIDAIGLANCAGVTSQLQQQIAIASEIQVEKSIGDRQPILLFYGASGARMGLPMSLAFRLEEFEPSAVEIVANQPVVQYRQTILPLVYLQAIFGSSDTSERRSSQPPLQRGAISAQLSEDWEANDKLDDKLQVIVVALESERNIGLVVEQILDIVEEPLAIAGRATRSGILYLAAIQGRVTEILDIPKIIQMTNPYLL